MKTNDTKFPEELDTVETIAKCVVLSPRQIHRLKNAGVIPFIKIGKSVRFNRRRVMEALHQNLEVKERIGA